MIELESSPPFTQVVLFDESLYLEYNTMIRKKQKQKVSKQKQKKVVSIKYSLKRKDLDLDPSQVKTPPSLSYTGLLDSFRPPTNYRLQEDAIDFQPLRDHGTPLAIKRR